MILAIAGIKYLDETYSLIKNAIKEKELGKIFTVEKININSADKSSNPQDEVNDIAEIKENKRYKILVLTDRDCEGMTIRPDECLNKIKNITSSISPDNFVIVNVDDTDLIRHLEGVKCHVVTFGFNSKAIITASSTDDDVIGTKYLCSLQSSIKSMDGDIIEPGEVKILDKLGCKVYSIMAYCGFLLVSGVKKPGD